MKLKSLNKFISLLIFTTILSQFLYAEEQIDLWKKENNKKETPEIINDQNISGKKDNSILLEKIQISENVEIENKIIENSRDKEIFGVYDPAENDFNLDMWMRTDA